MNWLEYHHFFPYKYAWNTAIFLFREGKIQRSASCLTHLPYSFCFTHLSLSILPQARHSVGSLVTSPRVKMINGQGEHSVLKTKFSKSLNLVENKWKTKTKEQKDHQANRCYLMLQFLSFSHLPIQSRHLLLVSSRGLACPFYGVLPAFYFLFSSRVCKLFFSVFSFIFMYGFLNILPINSFILRPLTVRMWKRCLISLYFNWKNSLTTFWNLLPSWNILFTIG